MDSPDPSILAAFSVLEDPRSPIGRRHHLEDILVITLCATICGADSYVEVAEWGQAHEAWLQTFLELPYGIPSHDTFTRVFWVLNPEQLGACFTCWTEAVANITEGEVIAIDGKTLRRSFHRASEKAAIHMVSAWATRNRLVLAQLRTPEGTNEITAVPQLLRLLALRGAIVTLDAMGCQKAIAEQIVEQGGDYVLRVKANHPRLHAQLVEHFDSAHADDFADMPCDSAESTDRGHGRSEERRIWVTGVPSAVDASSWRGLSSVALVERVRTVGVQTSVAYSYYLSSLPYDSAEQQLGGIRAHWGIENAVHWCLDMTFREDDSRVRKGHGAENMATVRHLALNLLRREPTPGKSLRVKRKLASWDHTFLLRVLGIHTDAA